MTRNVMPKAWKNNLLHNNHHNLRLDSFQVLRAAANQIDFENGGQDIGIKFGMSCTSIASHPMGEMQVVNFSVAFCAPRSGAVQVPA